MAEAGSLTAVEIARLARAAAVEKKAEDAALLDVRELTSVTDYCLVVSGASLPQLKAICDTVQHELKQRGIYCYRRSGTAESGWITVDYVDVVMHAMLPETRRYYAIEDLWASAPRLP